MPDDLDFCRRRYKHCVAGMFVWIAANDDEMTTHSRSEADSQSLRLPFRVQARRQTALLRGRGKDRVMATIADLAP
jgi:hypothetical protein